MPDTGTVLVVGGTSDIGRAIARRYAEAGWSVVLSVRDAQAAGRDVADLATRTGASVSVRELDILDDVRRAAFLGTLDVLPDTVVCVAGLLGEQGRAERDPAAAQAVFRTNFEAPSLLLADAAERFAARGSGTIVGISSVAGERGRASNYCYGAAKAGFTAFLSGLRNRLAPGGVRVVTVKPGFVRTRMTAGMKLPGPLTAEPDEVGRRVFDAAERGRGEVVYVRPIWRVVMAVIRAIPEPVFKRLKL